MWHRIGRLAVLISLVLATGLGGFAVELSPEAAAYVRKNPAAENVRLTTAIRQAIGGDSTSLNTIRAAMVRDTPLPAGVRCEEFTVEGRRVRLYSPVESRQDEQVVLYLHGGGWTIGCIERFARLGGELAKLAGTDVAVLDYRLAPEHPYPAALEDTLNAFAALKQRGYRRIWLAGDSAGGNLSAAAGLKLRAELTGIILIYPVTVVGVDDSNSWRLYGEGYGLDSELMKAFNDAYVPAEKAGDPLVSPLLADDVKDYPATYFLAAEYDILYDQGVRFAEKLKAAGVSVTHYTVPGSIHAFFSYPDMDETFTTGLSKLAEFLKGKTAD